MTKVGACYGDSGERNIFNVPRWRVIGLLPESEASVWICSLSAR